MRGFILNNPCLLFFAPPPPPITPSRRHNNICTKSNYYHHFISLRTHVSSSSSAAAAAAAAAAPSAASEMEIDMFLNPVDNTYTIQQPRAVILWDLDNKPPRGPPYAAALSLRRLASLFGRVDSFSAYANRHAFSHLPPWVLHQRRQERQHDFLERKGLVLTTSPYVCGVCGRKFTANLQLKKHFKQLHERERQKKLSRMRSLKSKKKRQRYKERFISNNHKYEEAARQLLTPKKGYGLDAELRRAGVFVKTVEDKPQAADAALKRQMLHWMGSGVDWMFLVSDDSDFTEMVSKAREADLQTVVVGDRRTTLGKHSDLWVPWMRVENGEVGKEEVMRSRRRSSGDDMIGSEEEEEGASFLSAMFYEGGNSNADDDELQGMADEIVSRTASRFNTRGEGEGRMSAFSEEEMNLGDDAGNDDISILPDDGLLSDSEDEEEEEEEEEEEDYYI